MKLRTVFLTGRLRDVQQLPLIGNISEKSATLWSSAVYFAGLVIFTITVICFTQFDSLKTKNIFISSNSGDQCEILSRVNNIYTSGVFDPISQLLHKINSYPFILDPYFKPPEGYTLRYSEYVNQAGFLNVYFSTYQDCITRLSGRRNAFYCLDGTDVKVNVTGTCNEVVLEDILTLTGTGNGRVIAEALNRSYTSQLLQVYPNISKLDVFNVMFTPEIICSPFRNLPPYKCSEYVIASPLVILSNGFALASAAVAILFMLTSFVLGQCPKYKLDLLEDLTSSRDTKHGILIMQSAKV